MNLRGIDGHQWQLTLCALPDDQGLGSDDDFLLVPMGVKTALMVANRFGCSLPTRRAERGGTDVEGGVDAVGIQRQALPDRLAQILDVGQRVEIVALAQYREVSPGRRPVVEQPEGVRRSGPTTLLGRSTGMQRSRSRAWVNSASASILAWPQGPMPCKASSSRIGCGSGMP